MAPTYRQPNFTLEVDNGGYANQWEADEFIFESYDTNMDLTDAEDDANYHAHITRMTELLAGELLQVGDSLQLKDTKFAGDVITRLPDAEPQSYERALAQAKMIRNNGGTVLSITAEPHPDTTDHHVVYYERWSRYETGTIGPYPKRLPNGRRPTESEGEIL